MKLKLERLEDRETPSLLPVVTEGGTPIYPNPSQDPIVGPPPAPPAPSNP